MPADPICFIDTETSGLDPERHEIWEVALIIPGARLDGAAVTEHHYFLSIDERFADPIGLAISRYDQRHPNGREYQGSMEDGLVWPTRDALVSIARFTHGLHLVGAIPSFDEERLRRTMLNHGIRPSWHYHIIDVEALAVGWLAAGVDPDDPDPPARPLAKCRPPWDSNELSQAVGVDPDQFDRHTAMGDARWAAAIYRAVMGQ